MAHLRVLLLFFAALPLFGAVCVTHVEQKGPAGPWVGEIVNTGSEPVHEMGVRYRLFDATGRRIDFGILPACPPSLGPGESGTFELFLRPQRFGVGTPPLRAEFDPIVPTLSGPGRWSDGSGLTVRLLEKYPEHRAVLGEVRNDYWHGFNGLAVCGNIRTVDGKLAEVGSAVPFPYLIMPGETRTFIMFFNSMPEGSFELTARGSVSVYDAAVLLDPRAFKMTASDVIEEGSGRNLRVVGEVRNTSGKRLSDVELQAYEESTPWNRVRAWVGCNGIVGDGETAAVGFDLRVDGGAPSPSIVVVGIEGDEDEHFVPLSARNVRMERGEIERSVRVFADLANPTDRWVRVHGVCFNLRDGDDRLVGTLGAESHDYVAPHDVLSVTSEVFEVKPSASAEIVAYGSPTSGPPPTVFPQY